MVCVCVCFFFFFFLGGFFDTQRNSFPINLGTFKINLFCLSCGRAMVTKCCLQVNLRDAKSLIFFSKLNMYSVR